MSPDKETVDWLGLSVGAGVLLTACALVDAHLLGWLAEPTAHTDAPQRFAEVAPASHEWGHPF